MTPGSAVGFMACFAAGVTGLGAVGLDIPALGWAAIVIDILGIGIEQGEEEFGTPESEGRGVG